MLTGLTSLFRHHRPQPTEQQIMDREWTRLLSQATSQNERDEINDMFTGAFAA